MGRLYIFRLHEFLNMEKPNVTTLTQEVQIASIFRQSVSARLHAAAALGEKLGVGLSGVIAIEHLAAHGPVSPSVLAHRLRLTSAAVTSLVDRLEAEKLVIRCPHPTDRRSVLVDLTRKSRIGLSRFFDPALDSMQQELGSLSIKQKEAVLRFLERFTEAMEECAAQV